MTPKQQTVWTVGHSTRPLSVFLELLAENGIGILVDVRRFPGSRRHPQFGQDALRESLASVGIEYVHQEELGGHRKARPDSRNTEWRNVSFRGYADYMETEEFKAGIERLLDFAKREPTAIMCAEAVWWRCHRGLIADDLKSQGIAVWHIMDKGKCELHPYTPVARQREIPLPKGEGGSQQRAG
jgi:uncharacterized protein (DUF488 family)